MGRARALISPMKPGSRTGLALILLVVLALGWEAAALSLPAFASTISAVIWNSSERVHLLPLAAGIWMGHLFGIQRLTLLAVVVILSLLTATMLVLLYVGQIVPAAFVGGYVCGTVFWSRTSPTIPPRPRLYP